jgi:DNA-binding transcriptional LysR family regulator
MTNTDVIKRFLRVAELGSFTKAAEALDLPKASISLAVQQLENKLGTQLLHRTTRKAQLTPDGEIFYDRGKNLLAEMDELDSLFKTDDANISGLIRVDMSTPIARNIVIPHLPAFLAQHPNLQVNLSCTDRHIDLIAEGFDCVIRTGNLTDSGLIVRYLGDFQQVNYVSTDYLAQYGEPLTIEDLNKHWLIHYNTNTASKFDAFEFLDNEICKRIPMQSRLCVNNVDAYQAACLAGLGIIQAPSMIGNNLNNGGKLVEILKDYHAPSMPISLLYPHRRNLSKRVRIFMDWVNNITREHLQQTSA